MKRFLFLLLFIFQVALIAQQSYAQSTFKFYDDISLPQTDAWNFVRQGEVSPSMYTGTINLSVPIYEYKDKDFTIPIVATYSSNGNTPNQIAGILGPGWNLELGGCITIETNGIPDYGENVKHVQGFYTTHKNFYYSSYEPNKWWRFMFNLFDNGTGTGAPQIVWCKNNIPDNSHTGEVDTQPDIFHFSVPGHSGKFHLGFRGETVFYDTPLAPSGYRLQIDTVPISNLPNKSDFRQFVALAAFSIEHGVGVGRIENFFFRIPLEGMSNVTGDVEHVTDRRAAVSKFAIGNGGSAKLDAVDPVSNLGVVSLLFGQQFRNFDLVGLIDQFLRISGNLVTPNFHFALFSKEDSAAAVAFFAIVVAQFNDNAVSVLVRQLRLIANAVSASSVFRLVVGRGFEFIAGNDNFFLIGNIY